MVGPFLLNTRLIEGVLLDPVWLGLRAKNQDLNLTASLPRVMFGAVSAKLTSALCIT